MNDMILVSVDDHVCEPPDMWNNVLSEKWKSRAPKLVTRADGSDVWGFEGRQIPNVGLNAVAGRPPEEYGMEPTALSQLRKGCYDVDARIDDMNANGVLGSLCFPSVPGFCGELFARNEDKELARVMIQAYNDWHIDEWCGAYPGRFMAGRDPAEIDIHYHNDQGGTPRSGDFNPDACQEGLHALAALGVTYCATAVPGDSIERAVEAVEQFGETVIAPLRR